MRRQRSKTHTAVRTPRTICTKVPIYDPCSNVVADCCETSGSVTPAPTYSTPSTMVPPAPPTRPNGPTPATRSGDTRRPTTAADQKPSISPTEPVPGPVDEEEDSNTSEL